MQELLLLLILSVVPAVGFAEPLRVVASVAPIRTFVKAIGGQHVDAQAMVRPGFNPHAYDPTPQQISALTGAVLSIRTGMPFEIAWMDRIRSANQGTQLLDARAGIALREMEAHAHDQHGHEPEHQEESDLDLGHGAEAPHGDHDEHDAAFDARLS
jgi:zinc transport system substrate-binding protein